MKTWMWVVIGLLAASVIAFAIYTHAKTAQANAANQAALMQAAYGNSNNQHTSNVWDAIMGLSGTLENVTS